MGPLQLLSAFNWCMALLLLAIPTFLGLMTDLPASTVLIGFGLVGVFAGPMMYLGLSVDKGRGRTLQSVIAGLSLLNFPIGTAYGAFALWACWRAGADDYFGDPPLKTEGAAQEAEASFDDAVAIDGDSSHYEYARRLADRNLPGEDIEARLVDRGLSDDEIETLLSALGVRVRGTASAQAARRAARRAAGTKQAPPPRPSRRPRRDE